MGCIRSFKHNAELQETRLTVKNGVFRTSETDLLLDFDEIGTIEYKTCPLLKI